MARPATLIRKGEGATVDHRWVPGASVETQIRAVIQAPSESDLRLVPEGERTEAWVTIWSRTELHVSDEDEGTNSDRVRGGDGKVYKLTRVVQRTEAGFTRAIARLEHDRGRRV
jgi:hypothetical protein